LASGKRRRGESIGSGHCALCKAHNYFTDEPRYCDGCPVKAETGLKWCDGTPYTEIDKLTPCGNKEVSKWLDTTQFKRLAKKELKFLKSLLP